MAARGSLGTSWVELAVALLAAGGGAYLTSLKTGAESDAFAAYRADEISRWD